MLQIHLTHSTVQYMRTACKNIMYTVVNSNAYAGETSLTLALWMKIMVGVDVAVAVILILLEVVLVKKYKKRKSVLIVVGVIDSDEFMKMQCCLHSTGEENNVANPEHPTSVRQMRKCLQKCHVYSCKQLGL